MKKVSHLLDLEHLKSSISEFDVQILNSLIGLELPFYHDFVEFAFRFNGKTFVICHALRDDIEVFDDDCFYVYIREKSFRPFSWNQVFGCSLSTLYSHLRYFLFNYRAVFVLHDYRRLN